MMDLDERLQVHLTTEQVGIRGGDVVAVMERGETIRRRRRLAAVTVPAAAVIAVVAAFVLLQGLEGPINPDIDRIADANAALSVEAASFEWRSERSTLAGNITRTEADGVMYVLSTAPGARWEDFPNGNVPRALYTSSDGLQWTTHSLDDAWSISSIAAVDGVLYAVATSPAAQGEPAPVAIARSTDQGATFEYEELIPNANLHGFLNTAVAATPKGVLAVVIGTDPVDPLEFLPSDVLEGQVEPVVMENGIAVFPAGSIDAGVEVCFTDEDSAQCREVIESNATYYATWEELGLDSVEFGGRVTRYASWSADGIDFAEIEYPFDGGAIQGVFNVGNEVVASVGNQLFASSDARTWRRLQLDLGNHHLHDLHQMGDRIVGIVEDFNTGGSSIVHADRLDGAWEEISVPDLLGIGDKASAWVSAASVNEHGVALHVLVHSNREDGENPLTGLARRIFGRDDLGGDVGRQTGAILYSNDLVNWKLEETSDLASFVDTLFLTPQGKIVAGGFKATDQRPIRMQYVAKP